jgi:peptide/nickel transport system substrate-binding protein
VRRNRTLRFVAVAGVFVLLAQGCSPSHKRVVRADATPRGGTLHVSIPRDTSVISSVKPPFPPFDPQIEYSYDSWELYRCCLLRTLLSYSGQTTAEGGAELRPDLAVALPDVSADGLAWTFTLKPDIHYSPPLANTVVTSQDFIRAISRMAKVGGHAYGPLYFAIIRGYADYAEGKSDSISGLEAPDPRTLLIRLTRPAGDLGSRMVMAGTAPIPPLAADPSAPFGVATGHDKEGYGHYLVPTGPYMIEGTDKLDFTKSPAEQPKLSGLSPGHSITLVRNPSWVAATDDLRKGYVDRIEVRFAEGDRTDVSKLATTGASDVDLSTGPGEATLVALAQKVRSDPSLGAVHVASADFVRYVSMNLAVPPFDDLHVRRALNFVVDKRRILDLRGGSLSGSIAGHTAFDSMEDNVLLSYNPFATKNDAGDLARAKAEMAQSAYDRNKDGVCDSAGCRNVVGVVDDFGVFPAIAKELAREIAPLGIKIKVKVSGSAFDEISDPKTHTALALSPGWGKDYINVSNFFLPLFSRDALGGPNYSLIGASSAQLREWRYTVSSTPSLDDRIEYCLRLVGPVQLRCWATLDQYVTEQVVPWVPLMFSSNIVVTSPRVVAFSHDQYAIEPSLDRIALKPGSVS